MTTPTTTSPTVAYFSMEAGLEAGMPTYSGGLGVLAGDILRAAADLGLSMVGITLLYRQGFFRQHLDDEGNQSELPQEWDPKRYLKPLDVRVTIKLDGKDVILGAWLYLVRGVNGYSIPVYLLDADLPENAEEHRKLTGQLYGGDQRYRLSQEAILGLGGVAVLRALGHASIPTYHMNEGHCALLTLALLDEVTASRKLTEATSSDIDAVRQHCVFTTHTPVPAGHDRFGLGLVHEVLGEEIAEALRLLPCCPDDTLNMTYLCLFFSRFANGVARLHTEVAREMYPGYAVQPITNGVHASTWVAQPVAALFDREIPNWRTDNHYLRQVLTISFDNLLEAHASAKRDLFQEIERRTGVRLDPGVLTIGFARRAATYKRADFIFSDLERLRAIHEQVGPLQLVFAGKAHPADDPGKEIIRRVFDARDELTPELPVVYLEEHDMTLGKLLCSGVDLWLNNPQKPQEASGTSGMKAAMNGVPSLSVLDGWWPEGWVEGVTGWSIEDTTGEGELGSLYSKLRYVIVPLYYGAPAGYARVMRSAIALNGSYFTAQRMVSQYVQNAYRRSDGQRDER